MRILATSTPGLGHLTCLLPLAAALRDAGHDVLFVTAAESCDLVAGFGFAVRPGGMSPADRRAVLSPRQPEVMAQPPRARRGLLFSIMFAEAAAPAMRVDLAPVVDDFRPDVVIHETGELAAAPLARARDIPSVTVAFSGTLPEWSHEMVLASLAPLWADEDLAAPTFEDVCGDLYLHPFPPSFDQAPSAKVVRPMQPSAVWGTSDIPPSWLERLGADRPLVYLTSGTEPAAAQAPWAAALQALGNLDVDAVATIGRHIDPAALGKIPSNVRVEQFVPQQFVLDRAAVIMSHAGAGSLLGAAAAGVPQLLNPIWADQWENADAASGSGAAITCELDRRSASDIATVLQRLLNEAQFKDAATRVAGEMAAMPSPADHVPTIEALAHGSS
jgi:UDP:flavonoid glycosyltransferase YjiC (YdhE family)